MNKEKRPRQFQFDNDTIARLERLRSRKREEAVRQGISVNQVTYADIIAKALEEYEIAHQQSFQQ